MLRLPLALIGALLVVSALLLAGCAAAPPPSASDAPSAAPAPSPPALPPAPSANASAQANASAPETVIRPAPSPPALPPAPSANASAQANASATAPSELYDIRFFARPIASMRSVPLGVFGRLSLEAREGNHFEMVLIESRNAGSLDKAATLLNPVVVSSSGAKFAYNLEKTRSARDSVALNGTCPFVVNTYDANGFTLPPLKFGSSRTVCTLYEVADGAALERVEFGIEVSDAQGVRRGAVSAPIAKAS